MAVAGVDFSTKAIDIVLLDDDTDAATWHRFELTGQDAFERVRAVKGAMPGASFWDATLAVGIEDPRGFGAGSLYRIQGAILACLPRPLLVQPLIPSFWRRTVGLPGNASKQDIALWAALKGFMPVDPQQDAWDAFAIAWATRSLIELTDAA